MEHQANSAPTARTTPPTAKEKNAVQRSVSGLLDALAPERATTRSSRVPVPVERHRTPTGCVLQAATAALSVSWFPDVNTDGSLGELQITVWHGVLSRRGSAPQREAAVVTQELVIHPVAHATDESVWRTADGTTYDVQSLAAHCMSLLESQMMADDPTGEAQSTTARRRD
jgi:hypothetical protein